MAAKKPKLSSLRRLLVPIFASGNGENALALARLTKAEVHIIAIAADGAEAKLVESKLRARCDELVKTFQTPVATSFVRSPAPLKDLNQTCLNLKPDLLIVDLKSIEGDLGLKPNVDVFKSFSCNTAILRGDVATTPNKVLLPVRGGPQVELSLRIAMSLSAKDIDALHFVSEDIRVDSAFKGLSRVFPQVPGVHPRYEVSNNPGEEIFEQATRADLVIMGSSAVPLDDDKSFGRVSDKLLKEGSRPVLLVYSTAQRPEYYEEDILEALMHKASRK